MLPTHALAGLAVGLAATAASPEHAGVALLAGLLGGVFPDLDLYAGHRKTLHYPVYYSALAGLAVVAAAVVPGGATVGLAAFLLAAAVHSVGDVFGGGLELRPWEATSDRAVYDHHRDRWLAPRRWIGYDGSPSDLLLSVGLGAPLFVALDGPFRAVVAASVAVGAAYVLVRRVLPDVADVLLGDLLLPRLPELVRARVPDRYRAACEASRPNTKTP